MIKPDKVILSNRKSLALKIDKTGKLIVLAPKNMSLEKIFKFISEKEKWIIAKQTQIKSTLTLNSNLINYEEVLFLGKKYPVVYVKNNKEIILTENALCLPSKMGFSTNRLILNLKQWYIKNAETILIKRANDLLKHMNLSVKSLSIINSKAKWGMCDSNKNIFLNYKLLFLSHDLIDYVIVHEITHLVEMNHSKNFYLELARVLPKYKTLQTKLKQCGFLLNLLTE
ncbi:MAG: M48 family metallopeptidase [Clostridiales bacterium]|nr:M48 family metallopeptidase [Clostridiales bacterium]